MKRTWTIIGVGDVPHSIKWYQSLLGRPETAPAHDHFGQILDADGTVLLCLHKWGAPRASLVDKPSRRQARQWAPLVLPGRQLDVALPRARALVGRLEEEAHVNLNAGTMEFSLRDPDGYYVTISALTAAQQN